jgi:hypothetical protein
MSTNHVLTLSLVVNQLACSESGSPETEMKLVCRELVLSAPESSIDPSLSLSLCRSSFSPHLSLDLTSLSICNRGTSWEGRQEAQPPARWAPARGRGRPGGSSNAGPARRAPWCGCGREVWRLSSSWAPQAPGRGDSRRGAGRTSRRGRARRRAAVRGQAGWASWCRGGRSPSWHRGQVVLLFLKCS